MPTIIAAERRTPAAISGSITTPGQEQQTNKSRALTWWLLLLLVWMISGLYTAHLLKRGWIPMDEGTIGQCAERTLRGEVPHRDFQDPYTGGLSYLNALAFRILGTNSVSPRIIMFLFFMAFVPAIFAITSRFTSRLGAAGATLLSVAWSVPNYPAAMPSWYNLFFATFGVLAALRFLETNRRIWIFVAGLCGGMSCLFKITGLYFVGAVCLTLIFRELCGPSESRTRASSRAYPIFLKFVFVLLASGLFLLVRKNLSVIAVAEFVFPGVVLAALCVWRDNVRPAATSGLRFASLFRALMPFSAGVLLPLLFLLIPYIRSGSLHEFLIGVFVLPLRRFDFVTFTEIPGIPEVTACVSLAALLAASMRLRNSLSWPLRITLFAVLACGLAAAPRHAIVYRLIVASARMLLPLCVLGGVLLLAIERYRREIAPLRQQQVMLLLSVASLCSLVQVPFGAVVYFCYVAPLLVIAIVALLSVGHHEAGFLAGSLVVFYTAFAVMWFTPTFILNMGRHFVPDQQTYALKLPRSGGLRVDAKHGQTYEILIKAVQEHAKGNEYVYCSPDCPEIPFFSGLQNPSSTLFDLFDNPAGKSQRVLRAIDSHGLNVVVIVPHPLFSKPMEEDLRRGLSGRFPEVERIGDFEVRWRTLQESNPSE